MMESLLASGQLIDAIIALTVLEGIALAVYHRATGGGIAPRHYALNLVSGLCLMLALRAVLGNAGWHWLALWLAASGLAHGADLCWRWSRQERRLPRGLVKPS